MFHLPRKENGAVPWASFVAKLENDPILQELSKLGPPPSTGVSERTEATILQVRIQCYIAVTLHMPMSYRLPQDVKTSRGTANTGKTNAVIERGLKARSPGYQSPAVSPLRPTVSFGTANMQAYEESDAERRGKQLAAGVLYAHLLALDVSQRMGG